jgi:hypothetical protein
MIEARRQSTEELERFLAEDRGAQAAEIEVPKKGAEGEKK